MLSPPSGSGVRAESFQRSLVPGGLFKAPMPPHLQPQQDAFCSGGGGVRRDVGFAQDFPSSPLSGLGSPHRSPYAQMPGTPRPDYSQQVSDLFPHQSPLSSRPSPDPYTNPQTPGTPRPHSDSSYLPSAAALQLEQFTQQSSARRPSPSHPALDPYASNPGTPRPSAAERFPRSPGGQWSSDPFSQPAGTPRPTADPYSQQPATPRPHKGPEAFSQASGESFGPQSAGSPLGPESTFSGTPHQVRRVPVRPPCAETCRLVVCLKCPLQVQQSPGRHSSLTPKHPGMSEEGGFTPLHDPFEQLERTAGGDVAALSSLDGPAAVLPQLGDSEEKLRQVGPGSAPCVPAVSWVVLGGPQFSCPPTATAAPAAPPQAAAAEKRPAAGEGPPGTACSPQQHLRLRDAPSLVAGGLLRSCSSSRPFWTPSTSVPRHCKTCWTATGPEVPWRFSRGAAKSLHAQRGSLSQADPSQRAGCQRSSSKVWGGAKDGSRPDVVMLRCTYVLLSPAAPQICCSPRGSSSSPGHLPASSSGAGAWTWTRPCGGSPCPDEEAGGVHSPQCQPSDDARSAAALLSSQKSWSEVVLP